MSAELQAQIDALRAEVAELRAQLWAGGPRLGPKPETPAEIEARATRLADVLVKAVREQQEPQEPALCTTDGRSVADARASQTNEIGQHPSYIVLCPDERAKGFVRPYRDAYKHVGAKVRRCQAVQQNETDENPHQCNLRLGHEGDHAFDAFMVMNGQIEFLAHHRDGGCGTVTRMGRALSETYARDNTFYGSTMCVHCDRHFPVAEFVWLDGQQVGS